MPKKRPGERTRISRFFVNLKIRYKFQFIFILVLLVIFAIMLSATQLSLNAYTDILYDQSAQLLSVSTVTVESAAKTVDMMTYRLLGDADVQSLLAQVKASGEPSPADGNPEEKNEAWEDAVTRLMAKLWNFTYGEDFVLSLDFVFLDGQVASVGQKHDAQELTAMLHREAGTGGSLETLGFTENNDTLVFAREVIYPSASYAKGTLLIRFAMKEFIQSQFNESGQNRASYLILSREDIVYPNALQREPFAENLQLDSFEEDEGYRFEDVDGTRWFIAYRFSETKEWLYLICTEYDAVFQNIIVFRNAMIWALVLLFVVTMWLSGRLVASVTRPLDALVLYMQKMQVQRSEMASDPSFAQRGDEIGYLYRNFSALIARIDRYVSEDYKKQLMIKDYEYRSLQSQINPHFLYNTFDSIYWLAKRSGQEDISTMISALSNLMRYSINKKDSSDHGTIKQELGILKDYISIQAIRHGDKLQFSIHADEQLLDCVLPKLTLQPIVENCINYAVDMMDEPCEIAVNVHEHSGAIEITVSDNGPGMSADQLEQLRAWNIPAKGLGIGLKNIHERIRIFFGEDYGVRFDNNVGGGLKVTVTIPKMKA